MAQAEKPGENVNRGKSKITGEYQAPLCLVLKTRKETNPVETITEIKSLKSNNEIIDYLVNNVEEDELKSYIEYFLSKAEKIKIPEGEYWDKDKIYEVLLEKSKKGENVYIKDYSGNCYHSLGVERGEGVSYLMDANNYKRDRRANDLEDLINKEKEMKKVLESIPKILEKGKNLIDDNLYEGFKKDVELLKEKTRNLKTMEENLNLLEMIKKGESWEVIKSRIEKKPFYISSHLIFLIIYSGEGRKDLILKCLKMLSEYRVKNFGGTELSLEELGLDKSATINDVAEKLNEKYIETKNKKLYIIFNGELLTPAYYGFDGKKHIIKQFNGDTDIVDKEIEYIKSKN